MKFIISHYTKLCSFSKYWGEREIRTWFQSARSSIFILEWNVRGSRHRGQLPDSLDPLDSHFKIVLQRWKLKCPKRSEIPLENSRTFAYKI